MADLNGVEVTGGNQLKEPAAGSDEWHRPALWGSCALTGDQCFDFVHCQCTHTQPLGILKFLMALLNTRIFCWFLWLSTYIISLGDKKKGYEACLKTSFLLSTVKSQGKPLRELVTKTLLAY